MYQQSTNFWGKDPMKWWIGQVTDPEKGEWGDSLEKTQADDPDGKDIYGFRCRVRIVGYHDCSDDLPDKDLPLAHILLPPNVSTTGGCGDTVNYQGGEVVVGFFADGDDGQQPVIFGTLFKQPFVDDELSTAMFNAKKQTCFMPYTPPKVRQMANKTQIYKGSTNVKHTAGEVKKTNGQEQEQNSTNITTDTFSPCEDNEISKISNAIKKFTKNVNALQTVGTGLTIDPLYGGVIDMQEEIKATTNLVHNSMTKLIRRGRSWLIQDTLDKLDKRMENSVDKFNQVVMGQATNALTSTIFCNIEKIQDELKDYLLDSLENMIGQVLDVPICGIENFMGDMFGQINNLIDSALGGMFGQLNSLMGVNLKLPSATFSKAIKFANIITNVLDCDQVNCPPTTSFSSKSGVTQAIEDGFDVFGNILDKAGLSSITNLAEGIDSIADGIPALPSAPNCSTNVLKCGPPRVDFLGGGGTGASGSAIVNALGRVIGVSIIGSGTGYTSPPLLSFFDSCDKGYGAGGYVKIKDGSVTGVVITSGGQEYLPNTTETTLNPDGSLTEKEVIPDPNANYDGAVSYVTSLDSIAIENVGSGYADDDTLTVDGGAEVELNIQDGFIVGANVVNGGFGFTKLPDLTINSDTGAGARLLPVLKFTKIDDATQLADTNVPFDRTLSQDVVVTVISCIEK
tara:strand:+ start:80 stop:2125 length:2046 start_codon:yes stop_codon:yes gene_type:complete